MIIVDGHDLYASKSTIERFPKAITICDAFRYSDDVVETARNCQYVICSQEFAETVSKMKFDFKNSASLVALYDNLRKKFDHQNVIVTLGSNGALYQIDNQIKVSPALKLNPVDVSGASDIFNGAFAYALTQNYNVEQAVRFANIAAGLSTQVVGGRLSIPKLQDVQKIYDEKGI